jgi:DGQHR domain-containing protein
MASREYFGCKVAQRGVGNSVEFMVFVVRTKDIMEWAGIRRVGEHEKGTQRIFKEARARAIKRFLERDKRNTIPVSVLVAFDPGAASFTSLQDEMVNCFAETDIQNSVGDKLEWGILSFDFAEGLDEHQRPALIVDGQHRLRGTDQLQDEDVPILVAAIIAASPEEQAFQFVVINSKAAKVPTDNVKDIVASQIDESNLQARLLEAGVNYGNVSSTLKDINDEEASPFYHLLDWPLNKDGQKKVQLTTIEACLRYIKNQFPILEEDEDTLKEIFMSLWRSVKVRYAQLWTANDKFMSKVNITALNEFVAERLAYAWEGNLVDIFDTEQVEAQTKNILSLIPDDFWEHEWLYKIQDNAVVRKTIKEDLRTISQNTRARNSWHEGLKLIGQV